MEPAFLFALSVATAIVGQFLIRTGRARGASSRWDATVRPMSRAARWDA